MKSKGKRLFPLASLIQQLRMPVKYERCNLETVARLCSPLSFLKVLLKKKHWAGGTVGLS